MTTLPTASAMIAVLVTTTTLAAQSADLNNDNVVDAHDLVVLTSNLNQSCEGECPTDLNNDGVTDSADIMVLMNNWGVVYNEGNESQEETQQESQLSSWQNEAPVLLDAIYYDQYTELFSHGGYDRWNTAKEYNQGEHAQAWCAANNVEVLPMVYGAVDWDHNNVLTDEDKEGFVAWLDETVPADYDGAICLDLEGQWWGLLDSSNQFIVDATIDFYIENLEYAQELRPNAKIGFWGFPKKTHTNPNSTTASVERLVNACTALFPDVYENNPGGNDSARLQRHVETCIEWSKGQKPIYVHASPRYKLNSDGYRHFHSREEFIHDQVQPAIDASWTDAQGKEHKVAGVALWDAYTYIRMYTDGYSQLSGEERKELWNGLDHMHVEYLSDMKAVIDVAANAFNESQAAAEAQAQQEANDAAQEAKEVAAAAISAERTAQQSRLTRRLDDAQTSVITRKSSYRKASRSYRSARKSFSKAKKRFRAMKKKYGKRSKQYRKALASYRKALKRMRAKARTFRTQRSTYRAARVERNNAQSAMSASASNWTAMANAAAMLTN